MAPFNLGKIRLEQKGTAGTNTLMKNKEDFFSGLSCMDLQSKWIHWTQTLSFQNGLAVLPFPPMDFLFSSDFCLSLWPKPADISLFAPTKI